MSQVLDPDLFTSLVVTARVHRVNESREMEIRGV